MRNGSVTPRKEGSAKQTQVMLLEGWSAEDVAQALPLARDVWSAGAMAQALLPEKVPQICIAIS